MKVFETILVLFYTALFSFIILRWKFFRSFTLPVKLITIIFITRVAVGILYGYVHLHFYKGGDTFSYFDESGIVFSTLKKNPWLYLRMVFWISYANPAPDIVPYKDIMWYYTTPGSYLVIRFHSVVRLVSFGYYNVHVVFYNFLTLIGILYLFLFFVKIIPQKKLLLIAVIFFFPSIIFWSSGIHKDGISLAALGLILYFSKEIFASTKIFKRQNLINFVFFLIGCWLLLIVRNYWLLLLIPALTAFSWTIKFSRYSGLKFLFVFALYFGIATHLSFIEPDWDFVNLLALMQSKFKAIADGSFQVSTPVIIPTISSVLTGIPTALENCLLRPWIGEAKNGLQIISAIENIIILICFLTAVIFRKKKLSPAEQSLLLFSLFFAFTIFIGIGITVPVLGALVRYKMVGVMLLLISSVIIVKDEYGTIKAVQFEPATRGK